MNGGPKRWCNKTQSGALFQFEGELFKENLFTVHRNQLPLGIPRPDGTLSFD